jgi:uncharacterized protein YtpQ (UPF0354 family)
VDALKVDGDLVVAIPARDVLMFTGSNNKEGLKEIRQVAQKMVTEAPHRLTPELFVYRDGRFQAYRQ